MKTALAVALAAAAGFSTQAAAQANEQFVPVNSYWVGPYAPGGSGIAAGMIDYFKLLNARDRGINGVKLTWEKCETEYRNDRGVECYERSKNKGPTGATLIHPLSTGITYSLIEKGTTDKIPIVSIGYGRTDASDGRVFPYVFTIPTNYWSQNTAKIRFIGQRTGGMEQLKGRKIAHVYQDSAYGQETIPILDQQAAQYGFTAQHLAVKLPGLDQKATWLRVRAYQPDWVILRSSGLMTPPALKEAAQVGVPRDKIVGNWWACSEQEMLAAGDAAIGYICATFHATGTAFPLIQDVLKYVYARGKGPGPEEEVG